MYRRKTNILNLSELYDYFKDWFKQNNPNHKIPSSRCFSMNIKRYKNIESVKVNGKSASGIKYLKIKYENDFF